VSRPDLQAGGPGRKPRRAPPGPARVSPIAGLILLLIAAIIAGAGWVYADRDAKHHRADVFRQLLAVADSKATELAQWRDERMGDASLFQGNAPFADLMKRFIDKPKDAEARRLLLAWLANVQTHYVYEQVSLFDAVGVERLTVPEGRPPMSSAIATRAPEVLRSAETAFEDFYPDESAGRARLSVLVPILDREESPIGLVVFKIDPEGYLHPMLRRSPTLAQTARTLLIRRDDGDALLLNDLKLSGHEPLTLRVPLENRGDVAVRAVLGEQGIVEGTNHQGTPVIAALAPVPRSPWFVVTQIHTDEVNAPLRQRWWMVLLLVGGLIAAVGAGAFAAFREQRLRDFKERLKAEEERAWLHYVVARSLNEVYAFDPETLRFRFANRGACLNLGYTAEELASLTPADLKPEFTEHAFRAMLMPLRGAERSTHVFETVHRRKDGSTYPVEVHLQLVDSREGAVFLAIVNDITDRRRAEARIGRLNRINAVLSDVNEAIVRIRDPQDLFAESCRIAVDTGGFKMAWVGVLNPEKNLVRPVAHAGVAGSYLDKLQIDVGGDPRGLGPTGIAYLEGRHDVCNDIETDPRMAPWREDALALGYRASAAFPLRVEGRTVAMLNLYSAEAGSFDQEELRLLGETAADLSFALELEKADKARQSLATAIEQAPVSVVITDASGLIDYVNPAFTSVTGYSHEEARGATPRLLKSGLQEPRFYEELWGTILAGENWRGEIINRRRDGTRYTQDTTIAPVRSAAGKVTHFVAISQDVTERKRTEAALQRSEERYRALFDRNLAGVYRTALEGTMLECNEAFARIFGHASREAAARDLAQSRYHSPDERSRFVARLLEDGVVLNHEFEGRHLSGRQLWLLENAHLVPADAPGEGRVIEGTLVDITERKLAEQALLGTVREKEALLKEVHHRVKNNLQVITSLLRLESNRIDHPATREVLRNMQNRILSMALLHESLYRSSDFAQVDLAGYLRQLTVQLTRSMAIGPGHVELDLDQAIPCGLIVNELVSNSLKHGFADGRPGDVWIELQALAEGTLRLRVKDNGAGFPADFESKRAKSLGLQLVADLAGQLRGRLEVGPGPGSLFEVTFTPNKK
jgi:PAS domain S-box-containing protein